MSFKTYGEALYESMCYSMRSKSNTLILGQGVTDFKGLFGTTIGLHSEFPERVIETPLAEDSVAGICIGLALNGMYPINTHIRADFAFLIFNQLINLASKYKYMFGGIFELPMLFRLVVGRSWGQGAQHSQSIQSLLAHIPGLVVLMPSSARSVLDCYLYAINHHRGPVVMLEHRLLYDIKFSSNVSESSYPFMGSYLERQGSDVTVVATSIMVLEAKRAASFLEQYGVSVEIIDLHCISHPDHKLIVSSVTKTGRLLTVDTSWVAFGVSAEVNRIINESNPSLLLEPSQSLGMAPSPCPTAKCLEDMFYPDVRDIVNSIYKLCHLSDFPLPSKESMTSHYKHFKGPF